MTPEKADEHLHDFIAELAEARNRVDRLKADLKDAEHDHLNDAISKVERMAEYARNTRYRDQLAQARTAESEAP